MKQRNKLYIVEMPAVSNEFAQELARRFTRIETKPGVPHEDLVYNAGQRSVVDFVLAKASGTVISSDVADLRQTENSQSLLQKILGKFR